MIYEKCCKCHLLQDTKALRSQQRLEVITHSHRIPKINNKIVKFQILILKNEASIDFISAFLVNYHQKESYLMDRSRNFLPPIVPK